VTSGPRGGYAKGRERRDAILTAANEVFATRGFRGASLATIAKRVGVSEPGLLHHFASKEELLLELLTLRDQHDDERIAQAFGAHAHVLEVLLELCRQNAERPGIVRLFTILAAESVDPDHPAHAWFVDRYRERRAQLAQQLAVEQREGTVATDVDAEKAAAQILAMFDGLQIQWLLDPDATDMVALFGDFLSRFAPPAPLEARQSATQR
jgi:AcrR family transcriptional regulator